MSYAAIVVGVVGTGYSIYNSEKQRSEKKKAAEKLNAENVRPIYNKPKEIDDVYQLAASEVNDTGLQDYVSGNAAMSEANGIDAILKSGGKADFATIHSTFGKQLAPMLQSIKNNRATNIANFNNAAYLKGKSSDTEFQYNRDQPFKDNKQLAALLKTQEAEARANTINSAISGTSSIMTALTKPGGRNGQTTPEEPVLMDRKVLDVEPIDSRGTRDLSVTPRPGSDRPNSDMDLIYEEELWKQYMDEINNQ
jgi:hypothetical protein